MRRITFAAAAALAALAAFAAFDVTKAPRVIPVIAPQSVSAGVTNSADFAVIGLRGISAVVVSADKVAGRSVDVTLYTTNAAAGGWTEYVTETIADTNAFTRMVSFPADGLTKDLRLSVSSIGGASVIGAFILSY